MYEDLRALRDAYASGGLSREHKLMLDNDSTDVYDEAADKDVFSMHPAELLEQALDLLGIPYEHV